MFVLRGARLKDKANNTSTISSSDLLETCTVRSAFLVIQYTKVACSI